MSWLYILIIVLVIVTPFIYDKIKQQLGKTNLEEKYRLIQSINKNVNISNWNLKEYIEKLAVKTFAQTDGNYGANQVKIDEYNIYAEYNHSSIWLSDIKNITVSKAFESLKFLVYESSGTNICGEEKEDKIKEVTFSVKYLENAERVYRIILNIIAINKKFNENYFNQVLTCEKEVFEFENLLQVINGKEEKLKKYITQYSTDIFSLIESSDKAIFASSLWQSLFKDKISEAFVAKDGFYTNGHVSLYEEVENFVFYAKGLRKRIKESWGDNKTLDSVVYLIIRNSVINYFAKFYKLNYGYETIDEYCNDITTIDNKELYIYEMIYAFNYISKTDMSLPLRITFKEISEKIDKRLSEIKLQRKEENLFIYSEEIIEEDSSKVEKRLETKENTITIEYIDQITGEEFEKFIGDYFKKIGYKATVTPLAGDFGVDIIVENELVKIGVQAKRYSDRVTNSAIQEIVAGIKHYNLDKGMVITNNYFTRAAKELAKDNNIVLWDRETLKEKLTEK
ncbi:MAG: restriction endonuclease [Clostridia bacterium]|nr:restriction endonuclease [Clostridia bacterium]